MTEADMRILHRLISAIEAYRLPHRFTVPLNDRRQFALRMAESASTREAELTELDAAIAAAKVALR
jgi:hypothetical protein